MVYLILTPAALSTVVLSNYVIIMHKIK